MNGKSKKGTKAAKPLTMAQELTLLLDAADAANPGISTRQALALALVQKAMEGNLKAIQLVYTISGDERREDDRIKAENPLFEGFSF